MYAKDLVALDVNSGKRLWSAKLDNYGARAMVTQDGSGLIIQETDYGRGTYGRWGSYTTTALTRYNLADGAVIWKDDSWAKKPTFTPRMKDHNGKVRISDLIEHDGVLYAYDQASNIGSDECGDLYALDPMTGKELWHMKNAHQIATPGRSKPVATFMTNNPVPWNNKLINHVFEYSPQGLNYNDGSFKNGKNRKSHPLFWWQPTLCTPIWHHQLSGLWLWFIHETRWHRLSNQPQPRQLRLPQLPHLCARYQHE